MGRQASFSGAIYSEYWENAVDLLRSIPAEGLQKGQVGAVVEIFADGTCDVEFVDKLGQTIALVPLKPSDLMVLQFELELA